MFLKHGIADGQVPGTVFPAFPGCLLFFPFEGLTLLEEMINDSIITFFP